MEPNPDPTCHVHPAPVARELTSHVSRANRADRGRIARALAAEHGGVVHRRELARRGIDRFAVRAEVAAGRWALGGRHTVIVGGVGWAGFPGGSGRAGERATRTDPRLWQAVWESGSGAVLDGAAALVGQGLLGFELSVIDVSVPSANRRRRVAGVRARRRRLAPTIRVGVPRVAPEWATIHAAQWAVSDRQAALLVSLAVQQRLVAPQRLLRVWQEQRRSPNRAFIDHVVRDVCDGARSLGELDFAALCRARGLPEPNRQVVREVAGGRVYLDVFWDVGLTVEVDGGHHALALHPVDDALRQNEVTLQRSLVLRIPVLGLRLRPGAFLDQVVRGYRLLEGRAA